MNIQQTLNTIIRHIRAYRTILIWLAVLGLLGFTLVQSQKISDPRVDRAYLEAQRAEQEKSTASIELSETLREQINNLERTPVDTDPEELGTSDPFHP